MTRKRRDHQARSNNVWPHELETVNALRAAGRNVELLPRIEGNEIKSADITMDGVVWEMKAPLTHDIRYIQRILRRAAAQSPNVIVDSARLKAISDKRLEAELRRLGPLVKSVRRLILVTKEREVIDIPCQGNKKEQRHLHGAEAPTAGAFSMLRPHGKALVGQSRQHPGAREAGRLGHRSRASSTGRQVLRIRTTKPLTKKLF